MTGTEVAYKHYFMIHVHYLKLTYINLFLVRKHRLELFDSTGKFDAVLSRHSSGNKIAAKGAILIRIIEFVLNIKEESKEIKLVLYMLGKSHAQKAIRPWQYSVFVQALLNTMSSRLGTAATSNVMEAWVNLFAYVMRAMLPLAIKDQVVETELNINTSSQFADGRIAAEVQEIEEVKDVKKRLKSLEGNSTPGGSVRHSNAGGYTSARDENISRKAPAN